MAQPLLTRLVLWAFDRFYHEGAWSYDTVAWLVSRGYWPAWVATVLPDVQDRPILELGCGTGYLQHGRLAAPQLTVGLDESAPMLRHTRRRLRRAGAAGGLVRGIAQRLPFGDHVWPIVVSTFPAPYLFDPATLAEIRRVLRPDGHLLIVDGGVVPPGLHQRAIATIYRVLLGAEQAAVERPGSGVDRRVQRLEQAGFAVRSEWRTVGRSQVQVLQCEVADGWHV
ncbi:MAG: methyltransferase domain-containing protein [Herpetosiphonaceae bacterium]|nr:methyltransferase domain-containing protein [Herpetosiphonaceae bacterium]